MNAHDDALFDDVAVLALGALPSAEAHRVAAHVAGCAACAQEYADLRAAADALAFAADAPELDELRGARMKLRVMRAIREQARTTSQPVRSRPAWLPWGAAAAAALAALAFGLQSLNLHSQDAQQGAEIATLQRALAPGSRHYAVPNGEVVTSGSHLLLAVRMPAPPAGKVYQAWTLRKGTTTMAPSLTFKPDTHGVAVVELPESAGGIVVVAVTLEPEGGSLAPTSKPLLVRKLL